MISTKYIGYIQICNTKHVSNDDDNGKGTPKTTITQQFDTISIIDPKLFANQKTNLKTITIGTVATVLLCMMHT